MNRCDSYEPEISALLDGELDHPRLLRTVDHLTRCHRCSGFYQRARALHGLLPERDEVDVEEPLPAQLWPRIERAAAAPRRSFLRLTPTLVRAAAVVVAAGLALILARGFLYPTPTPAPSPEAIVELGSRSGQMTAERFVQLATEVLEADDVYRSKMLELMQQASRVAEGSERTGADGGLRSRSEEPVFSSEEPTDLGGADALPWLGLNRW